MPKAKEQSVNSLLAKGKVNTAVELAMEIAGEAAKDVGISVDSLGTVARFRTKIRAAIYALKCLDGHASDQG